MKITNLITILEAIKAKHGDIDVVVNNSNTNDYPVSFIDVNDGFDVSNEGG